MGALAGKAFPYLIGVVLLYWAYTWVNGKLEQPEKWNGAAKQYYDHVGTLKTDSANWHGEAIRLTGVIVLKDSVIKKLTTEFQDAVAFGQQWKGLYSDQVAVADANSNLLTNSQKELVLYKRLKANGTLSGVVSSTLTPSSPEVVDASLKTADREAIGTAVRDSMSKTLGVVQAANERLSRGLTNASTGLATISKQARANVTGGIWPFNHRRRKENKALAAKADTVKQAVDEESEFEKLLNKKQ